MNSLTRLVWSFCLRWQRLPRPHHCTARILSIPKHHIAGGVIQPLNRRGVVVAKVAQAVRRGHEVDAVEVDGFRPAQILAIGLSALLQKVCSEVERMYCCRITSAVQS